jgi:hypothetical protein
MENEFLIPMSFFAMVFGIVYILVRRKERLQMIERGVDASLFEKKRRTPSDLKWGMIFVGIGVGILLGKIFAAYSRLGEEASFFSMICLCGGLSLVIFHILARKMEKDEMSGNA